MLIGPLTTVGKRLSNSQREHILAAFADPLSGKFGSATKIASAGSPRSGLWPLRQHMPLPSGAARHEKVAAKMTPEQIEATGQA